MHQLFKNTIVVTDAKGTSRIQKDNRLFINQNHTSLTPKTYDLKHITEKTRTLLLILASYFKHD